MIHIEVMSKRTHFGFFRQRVKAFPFSCACNVIQSLIIFMFFFFQEALGHLDINLNDVVNNGRINEKYDLINSKNGVIFIDIRWEVV